MTKRGLLLRVALLIVAALLPASLLTSPAVSAPTPETTYASQARKATNAERTSRQLAKLSKSACLQRFAVSQAQKMANQRRIFHQPLQPILNRCGLGSVGENVAYGYPNGSAVVRGWMNSPGHRANILNGGYRQMGLAARKAGNVWYVAQVFGRAL
jgi:uncharacterized protein YkwD